jgi:hypothetical protein
MIGSKIQILNLIDVIGCHIRIRGKSGASQMGK